MTDIVEKLKEAIHNDELPRREYVNIFLEAADEIERLRSELEKAMKVVEAVQSKEPLLHCISNMLERSERPVRNESGQELSEFIGDIKDAIETLKESG